MSYKIGEFAKKVRFTKELAQIDEDGVQQVIGSLKYSIEFALTIHKTDSKANLIIPRVLIFRKLALIV